ncbi:MAG: DUF1201 domain-containing protein [Clostridia bacterium]|nr:DUF1201 domain-containing protein [Clostridia bacterium]
MFCLFVFIWRPFKHVLFKPGLSQSSS